MIYHFTAAAAAGLCQFQSFHFIAEGVYCMNFYNEDFFVFLDQYKYLPHKRYKLLVIEKLILYLVLVRHLSI